MPATLNIGAPSGSTLYAVIRDEAAGTVWNGTAFEAWDDARIAFYDVPLTDRGGDYYSTDFPADIAPGSYYVSYYEQAGVSPSTADLKLPADEEVYWTGLVIESVPPVGTVTIWGTRLGMEMKVNGARNLREYVAGDANPDETPEPAWIAAAINDNLEEAATDMHTAWQEGLHARRLAGYTVLDVPLGSSSAIGARWLKDSNEYGAVVKGWTERTIDAPQGQDVPQQIGTATDEWTKRLAALRGLTALLDYQAAEGIIDNETPETSGGFEFIDVTYTGDTALSDEFSSN